MLVRACVAILGLCGLLSGCATIVHSGPRTVSVASTPAGAKVSVYDRDNALLMTNTTPFVVPLNTKYGYFKSQTYRLVFELPGYAPAEVSIDSKVSGWYFANLAFGGLIGMLIVDPLTGAMFNLEPDKIEQPLTRTQAGILSTHKGILVMLVSDLTPAERASMVPVN